MEVPLNEIMVLAPFDGEVVDHDSLTVRVATGYGVLTFLTITVNGRVVLDVGNIDVGETGEFEIDADVLRVGENVLVVNSWHQLPGRSQRLAEFEAPPVRFTVTEPAPPPARVMEIVAPREGATVPFADVEVGIVSRYRKPAFVDVQLNGKKVACRVATKPSATNHFTIAKKHLKPGKNELRTFAWREEGGRTNRVATYASPARAFRVSGP